VGAGKDSKKRQRAAVTGYARRNGIEIVEEFYDAAVSGADPVDARLQPPAYGGYRGEASATLSSERC
jgi:hypothetical protein